MSNTLANQQTVRLLAEGWLPGWAGAVVFALAAAFVVWMWRRESVSLRPTIITRWVLPALRVLVVGWMVWLLCRPVLRIVDLRQERPSVVVAVDQATSMSTIEGFGAPHRKLDVIEATEGRLIAGRDRSATTLAAACRAALALMARSEAALSRELALYDQGLPLAPAAIEAAAQLAQALPAHHDALADLVALDRLQPTDAAALAPLASATARRRALQATLPLLAQEAALAIKPSERQVELLKALAGRVRQTLAAAEALATEADALQDALDRAMIAPAEWAALGARRASRHDYAQAAARRLRERLGDAVELRVVEARGPERLLDDVFSQRIAGRAAAAVVISDGAAPADRVSETARKLAVTGLPVHTVLAAVDGLEPDDLAVAAVEAPMVAVRGTTSRVRVLVKNAMATTRPAGVEIRRGATVLARRSIGDGERGLRVIEVPVTWPKAGRHSLLIELRSDSADSFPGNERQAATVDVLEERARVVVLADRATENLAAYTEVLRGMPHVRATVLATVGGGGKLKLGGADGVPLKAEEWRGTTLAVLIGAVPRELLGQGARPVDAEALRALRAAMEHEGLRVLVHPEPAEPTGVAQPADSMPARLSWAEALGLRVDAAPVGARALPRQDLWSEVYRLAADEPASRERWQDLPAVREAFHIDEPQWPLILADQRALVGVTRRGRGAVVFNGLGDLAALRDQGHSGVVNRIIRGLVDVAIAQAAPPATDRAALFPPQAVVGRGVYVVGAAASATQPHIDAPAGAWRIVTADEAGRASLAAALGEPDLAVQPGTGLADLNLMPRAAPLRAIAQVTRGSFVSLDRLADLPLSPASMPPVTTRITTVVPLWQGWWPTPVLLALVSCEYLLRRRAGRVM